MKTTKYPFIIASTFLWIGFVGAISFMEAWLKFRAPGIDIPLGLGIGRLVFSALNKVEWCLALIIMINLLINPEKPIKLKHIYFIIPFVLLILQTFWLLPVLDVRAEMHIQGQFVPPSNLHFMYIGFEAIKIFCLLIFGISQFEKQITKQTTEL